ncbi:MAG TPA: hypothetical protein VNK23_12155 [Candidatus Dormibacteraeota bacterium]|nr:hypothetical protein [Candidatus Dormibacteraeota bacterium]
MKKLSEYLNTHAPNNYVRMLGEQPVAGPVGAEHHVNARTLVSAFGPPEVKNQKHSTLIFWNFARDKGASVFTLAARIRHSDNRRSPVRATYKRGSLDFHVWVNDRIGAVENGDAAPLFRGSGAFSIMRVA